MRLCFSLNEFSTSGFVFVMMGVPRVGRGIGQRSTGRSEEGGVSREEGRGSQGRWTSGGSGRKLEKTS